MEPIQPYSSTPQPELMSYASKGLIRMPVPRLAALVAMIMLGVACSADVVLSISTYMQVRLLDEFIATGHVSSMAAVEANDMRQRALFVVWVATLIACAITFLIWFYRAHAALGKLGVGYLNHSNGATIGWWFCPIANLFMPCKVMLETARQSNASRYASSPGGKSRSPGTIVGFWWAAVIVQGIVWRFGDALVKMEGEDTSAQKILKASWILIVASFPHIVAGVLGIFMIRSITKNQERLAADYAARAVPNPTPGIYPQGLTY